MLEYRVVNLHHHRIPELVEGLLAFFVLVQPRAKKKGSPSTSSSVRRLLADSDITLPALAKKQERPFDKLRASGGCVDLFAQ
jgi:hypothetical protein